MPYMDINDPVIETSLEYAIENKFLEYFSQRGIDITDMETANKMRQQYFYAALRHVFRELFAVPDDQVKAQGGKLTSLDYNDTDKLIKIANIYIDICEQYHVEANYYGYCRLTGIDYHRFLEWVNGGISQLTKPKDYIYLGKLIQGASQNYTRAELETSAIGQITKANHDEEKGLLYARKSAVAALGAVKIDSLTELTGRYIEHNNVSVDQ